MPEANQTARHLNILVLEDQRSDALLMIHTLNKTGYEVEWKRVETGEAFSAELSGGKYDLVLSDYALPAFNARLALNMFNELGLDIPFIVVTGSLGEEQAVELMKMGATDYLIKDRLARLGGAVSAALEQKRLRDERKEALRRLSDSEERFRRIAENAMDVIYRYRVQPEEGYEFLSPAVEGLVGYPPEAFYNDPAFILKVVHSEDHAFLYQQFHAKEVYKEPYVMRWVHKDGTQVWTEQRNVPVYDETGQLVAVEGVARNISDRVARERERDAIISVAAALRDAMTRAEILPEVVVQVENLIKADRVALTGFEVLDGSVPIEASTGAWQTWQNRRLEMGEEIQWRVLVQNLPFVENDLENHPPKVSGGWLDGLRSLVCVPLKSKGEALGILWVGSRFSLAKSTEQEIQLKLLMVIADITASALHRARLYEETQLRVQRLTALRTMDRAMSSSLDRSLMINVLLDQLIGQEDVNAVALHLIDSYSHMLRLEQSRGFRGLGKEQRLLRLNASLAGTVVLDRRDLNIHDLSEHPVESEQKSLYLEEGLRSYLGVPLMAKGEVLGVLEIMRRTVEPFDLDWLEFVEAMVGQVAIALNNAELFDKLQRTTYDLDQAYDSILMAWATAVNERATGLRTREESASEEHAGDEMEQLLWWTVALGREMGLSDTELMHLRRGAMLHDIGLMVVPETVLNKPGPLNDKEWTQVRIHPQSAFDWLSPILTLHSTLRDIPYCHHEAWDGSGYPRGLKAAQIPLAARIFSVADVWMALRSNRPFRKAWTVDRAVAYIRKRAGVQFDPQVVAAFLNLVSSSDLDEETEE